MYGVPVAVGRVLPDTVNVRGVINKGIAAKYFPVLVNSVDVKQKDAARVHKKRNPVKRLLYIAFGSQVVQAVERTDTGIDCSVQIELLHFLAQEQNVKPFPARLLLRDGKHILRRVRPKYVKPQFTKRNRQAARAAGKVERQAGIMPVTL